MAPQRTTNSGPKEDALRFEVDSALLLQLGEQLVGKRSVAVGELVKNAFDADAHDVIIQFKDVSKPDGRIDILDSGTGITFDRFQSTWMRIATRDKADNPTSPRFGRPRAGSKGIGRFAAHRLATGLRLESTAVVSSDGLRKEKVVVTFIWDDFRPGKDLDSVPITYSRQAVSADTPTGTLLQLLGVRDAWSEDDFKELRKDLLQLISPGARKPQQRRGFDERDPGFDIVFDFDDPNLEEHGGSLSDDFLSSAYGTLEGSIDQSGNATYSVTFRDQANKKPYKFTTKGNPFCLLRSAKLRVHYFVYRSDVFAGLDWNMRSAKAIGREHAGVQVEQDGFRVPPYGDPGDDWLSLDADRGRRLGTAPKFLADKAKGLDDPMLLLPGTNQLFGHVSVARNKNPELIQLANREGFTRNDAFESMRHFTRHGIDWLTVAYARHTAGRREKARDEKERPSRVLEKARSIIKKTPGIDEGQRQEVLQAIDLAVGRVEEDEADRIGELQMLRVLASTGTMIHVFSHQLIGLLEGLRRGQSHLSKFKEHLPKRQHAQYSKTIQESETWLGYAEKMADLVGLLLGTKSRSRRRKLAVLPLAEEVARTFGGYTTDNNIEIKLDIPKTLRTPPMFECEINAILVNLLTNALKAVLPTPNRTVSISARHSGPNVVIAVSDTGVGVDLSSSENYFLPFVSNSKPDPILGTGTGLGLKIVRDFADVYAGTAKFVTPIEGYQTTIEIILPESSNL